MEYKKWIILRDDYDTDPYECPYCGARVGVQTSLCPNCKEPVIPYDYSLEDKVEDYERLVELLVKLP